jgi:hypothetical protein
MHLQKADYKMAQNPSKTKRAPQPCIRVMDTGFFILRKLIIDENKKTASLRHYTKSQTFVV